MMNTTGAFQTAAMLSASWNVPMLVAPSPKKVRATFGRSCIWNPTAAPTAIGSPAPTMALAPMLPFEKSIRCIEPPTPPEPPVVLPISSAKAVSEVIPRASASPWPRYVLVWTSPGPHGRDRADRDRLLALAQVGGAADLRRS